MIVSPNTEFCYANQIFEKSATEGQISSHIILAYSLSNHKHNANVYKANIQKKISIALSNM